VSGRNVKNHLAPHTAPNILREYLYTFFLQYSARGVYVAASRTLGSAVRMSAAENMSVNSLNFAPLVAHKFNKRDSRNIPVFWGRHLFIARMRIDKVIHTAALKFAVPKTDGNAAAQHSLYRSFIPRYVNAPGFKIVLKLTNQFLQPLFISVEF
jgi:hypothetical protein